MVRTFEERIRSLAKKAFWAMMLSIITAVIIAALGEILLIPVPAALFGIFCFNLGRIDSLAHCVNLEEEYERELR